MPVARRAKVAPDAFCRALAAETEAMLPGSWRMLDTVARRLGVGFFEAEAAAKERVRRGWVELEAESVRLEDEGRSVVERSLARDKPAWAPRRVSKH